MKIDGLNRCWDIYSNTPYRQESLFKLNPKLKAYLNEKFPDYMVPVACITLNKFPLTANGKIDVNALPLLEKERPKLENSFVEPTTELEKRLAEIWSDVLGISNIGVNDSFFEIGGHSLLATQLIFKLRDKLHIEIPLKVLFEMPTISWMASTIESLQNCGSDDLNSTLNLIDDTIFNYKIRSVTSDKIHFKNLRNIFLTGATGFLGAYLFREIAINTTAQIYCLVRGKDENQGLERLKKNLQHYDVWDEKYLERIKIVNGDLGKPLIGLSEIQFNYLANEIDVIYHNGSKVHFVAPYVEHRSANVLGTNEMIKLTNTGRKKELHYISTTHVYSYLDVHNNVIHENKRPIHPEALTMGYTQSKWVAETMIANAAKAGLPAYIYRPGRIWGDSRLGNCQSSDFLWLILIASIKIGAIPKLNVDVDVMPVDFVSSAILELSNQKVDYGTAYNMINPTPIKWMKLVEYLEAIGYKMELVSIDMWQKIIIEKGRSIKDHVIHSLIPLLDESWKDGIEVSITVECKNMINALENTDVKCPIIDIELFKRYIDYFIKIGVLNSPIK